MGIRFHGTTPTVARTQTASARPARKQAALQVAVVEPRTIARRGLVSILQQFGYDVVLSVATGTELMAEFAHYPRIAVVILELEMDKPDGFFVQAWLCARWPAVRTIGFGTALSNTSVQRAMRQHMGCLVDDRITDAELHTAVDCMAAGGHHISALMRRAWGAPAVPPPARRTRKVVDLSKLSPCELAYFETQCSMPHAQLSEIAAHMKKKLNTVRTLKQRVFAKLGINSAKALLLIGMQVGLVRP